MLQALNWFFALSLLNFIKNMMVIHLMDTLGLSPFICGIRVLKLISGRFHYETSVVSFHIVD